MHEPVPCSRTFKRRVLYLLVSTAFGKSSEPEWNHEATSTSSHSRVHRHPDLSRVNCGFYGVSKKTALFVSVARDGDAQCLSCFESRLKLARAVPCREWLADTISLSRLHCMCAHCKGQGWTSCWELSTVDSLTVVHVPSVIVLALKPIAWARGPIPRFRKPTHRAIPTTTRAITADRWPRGVSNWFPQTAS
jgi:hypothetical protein